MYFSSGFTWSIRQWCVVRTCASKSRVSKTSSRRSSCPGTTPTDSSARTSPTTRPCVHHCSFSYPTPVLKQRWWLLCCLDRVEWIFVSLTFIRFVETTSAASWSSGVRNEACVADLIVTVLRNCRDIGLVADHAGPIHKSPLLRVGLLLIKN